MQCRAVVAVRMFIVRCFELCSNREEAVPLDSVAYGCPSQGNGGGAQAHHEGLRSVPDKRGCVA